jgi:peptide methionine sulfoxide reductase msrA/msrB
MKTLFLTFIFLSSFLFAKTQTIYFGMGCFWGAEKRIAELPGVLDVESGYSNGDDKETSYYKVLIMEKYLGKNEKNHAEVIKVQYDDTKISTKDLLIGFWENHNPTQLNAQGNDVGTNYRSAIYYTNEEQKKLALETKKVYQNRLEQENFGSIKTVIEEVYHYNKAEEYHQDYLKKKPDGYCGLGGTGVKYYASAPVNTKNYSNLNFDRQLIVFESDNCPFCEKFKKDILNDWKSPVAVVSTKQIKPPKDWKLEKALFATPTIVLFKEGKEVSRYTGYQGDKKRFWEWLGFQILDDAQKKIAFENGTERRFTGSHLDEKREGTYVDPITGAPLFRSDTKFKSGTGWPSFFNPIDGAITEHLDNSYGMKRVEIRSASSGIHLGHVFNDGPPPTGKRYCINGKVLKFIPDEK